MIYVVQDLGVHTNYYSGGVMDKPLIFIGSSSEGLEIALAIQANLRDISELVVWKQGVFGLGQTYIESLELQLEKRWTSIINQN